MASRLELQKALEELMSNRNVYFQPPTSIKMQYPAIRYTLKSISSMSANNQSYSHTKAYEIILIDYDPDSKFVDKLLRFPMCSFDRHYTADNLHHYIFTIYY